MIWVVNCVLVFSVLGLCISMLGFRFFNNNENRSVNPDFDAALVGFFLSGIAFIASILIIIVAKLGG